MKQYLGLSALFLASAALAVSRPYVPPVCPAPPSGFYVAADPVPAAAASSASAPAARWNLYKPDGTPFVVRGTNWVHWDSPGAAKGLPNSGANTVRMVVDFKQPQDKNLGRAMGIAASGMVPMPANWGGTCKSDVASFQAIVDTWVDQAATWTQLNGTGLINIANEWGPANSAVWRDEYVKAVTRMRAAGYSGTLVVDSGGCGQDVGDLKNYARAVLDADPQHNVLFDLHVYGNLYDPVTASWQQAQSYAAAFPALKATGLPIIVGEFGPGRKVGPSPTMVTPERVVADAEANGFGWLAWAWDDNNLNGCQGDDNWFAMTKDCGRYTGKDGTELTTFGKAVVPLLKNHGVPSVVSPVEVVKAPALTTDPALHCKPNYSCAIQLAASSPIGSKVSFAMTGNDKRISLSSTGVFAWYTGPVAGTYPVNIVLTDAAGNSATVPVTLTVAW